MFKWPTQFPKLYLKLNKVTYGKRLRMLGWPFVFRFPCAQISIGDGVTINSGFFSNLVGLNHRTIIVARGDGKVLVGSNVGLSGTTIYAWDNIEIGDNTIIGANTKIVDTDFHPIDPIERLNNSSKAAKSAPVKIGKNVFVGMNVIILKGSQIGDNCVIGAGAVVSGKFPSNCIIVGNPAKVIKTF